VIGQGFSAVSIVGDRLFTMDSSDTDEFAISLDAATGRRVWATRVGHIFLNEYGNGPRSTPTVDGDRVVVLGSLGRLSALRASDGGVIWQVELRERLGSDMPTWAFTSAPLIDGERVVIEAKVARLVATADGISAVGREVLPPPLGVDEAMKKPRVRHYDDYRVVAGVQVPFSVYADEALFTREYHFTSVDVNPPLPASLFTYPGRARPRPVR
jgi:hypothetical protein